MILTLQSCFSFNSLFFYITCFIDKKNNLPVLLERENILSPLGDEEAIVMRLLKEISHFKDENEKSIKKIFVKRIVPHGAPPTGLEYDDRFKTLYKPLMRIHQGGALSRNDRAEESKHDVHYDRDRPSLEPFEAHSSLDGRERTRHVDSRSDTLEPFNDIDEALGDILRSSLHGRSLEIDDGASKGKQVYAYDEISTNDKNKKWLPHYPYWNYWTYRKPIHEDICPGQQVKVGNMCIWLPPH